MELKEKEKGLGLEYFCAMVLDERVMDGLGNGKRVLSGLGYFGDILVEGCRI